MKRRAAVLLTVGLLLTITLVAVALTSSGAIPLILLPGQGVSPEARTPSTSADDDPLHPLDLPSMHSTPWATAPTEPTADERAGVLDHDIPDALSGDLEVLPGAEQAPDADRSVQTVRIEMEKDLPIDIDAFGDFVMDTLNDDRSWGKQDSISFARTDGDADWRVLVASPGTIDELCAPLATNGQYSCGRNGHAAINAQRWVNGADPFEEAGGSITEYRRYAVNHEMGHLLGYQHQRCPALGEEAPVMLQQTITLDGCEPNGWPR